LDGKCIYKVNFYNIRTFTYPILLRLWDIYLLKGEIFLYEIGLSIIKLQEKDLMSIPVKDVLKNLKKYSLKINEDELFNTIQEIDIADMYNQMIFENNLAFEKGLLFQSFLND
jgi:cytohesin/brefeldin A-inhibited guanine nucleotide-exchange protein